MGAMIEVHDLVKKFGDFCAVDHISFTVPEGKIFGFLGPNGAGKTTTIKMLTTVLNPTSGALRVDGHDPAAGTAPGAPFVRDRVSGSQPG